MLALSGGTVTGPVTFEDNGVFFSNTSTSGNEVMLGSNNSKSVSLRAPSSLSSNVTLTLPSTSGEDGDVLKSDGSGGLNWVKYKQEIIRLRKDCHNSGECDESQYSHDRYSPLCPDGYEFHGGGCECFSGEARSSYPTCYVSSQENAYNVASCSATTNSSNLKLGGADYPSSGSLGLVDPRTNTKVKLYAGKFNRYFCTCSTGMARATTICSRMVEVD